MLSSKFVTLFGGFRVRDNWRESNSGLWLDASDTATGWQDSSKTAPAALDSPIGYRASKAGNIPGVLQHTAGNRPLWKRDGYYSDLFDGTDDGYAAAFDAGTLGSNMDFFAVLKRNADTRFLVAAVASGGDGFGACFAGASGTTASVGVGSASTYLVNGVAVPGGTGTTMDQLNTAVPSGQWLVLEVRNLDLSSWTGFLMGGYAGWFCSADIGAVILCPAQSETRRARNRRWIAALAGVSVAG